MIYTTRLNYGFPTYGSYANFIPNYTFAGIYLWLYCTLTSYSKYTDNILGEMINTIQFENY